MSDKCTLLVCLIAPVLLNGAAAFDYHSVRGRQAPVATAPVGTLEGEALKVIPKVQEDEATKQKESTRNAADLTSGHPSNTTHGDVSFRDIAPVMNDYCYRCHGGQHKGKIKIKGKVNLKKLKTRGDYLKDIELVNQALEALDAHEMPPEDEEQMPRDTHQKLSAFFDGLLLEYNTKDAHLAPIVMRRMTRYEYNNAVRDLLELKGDIFVLPEKVIRAYDQYFKPATGVYPEQLQLGNRALGKNQIEQKLLTGVSAYAIDLQAEHGFNNRGDELSLSPILLESFLKLGTSIVNSPEFKGYSHKSRHLFEAPAGKTPAAYPEHVSAILGPLLVKAFRGPLDDATLNRYVGFFAREFKRTGDYDHAMKQVVAAILASPRFIYIAEHKRGVDSEAALTDYELATRLSFFLWSSIPDDALLALAEKGTLSKPDVLDAQVTRMLEDARSQALSQNFARQWLRLDQLIAAVPDFERFEAYYARIGCEQWKLGLHSMLEPLLLFESIMVEDRSVMLLVDCNYSFRSDALQSWYDTPQKPFKGKGNVGRFPMYHDNFKRRALSTRREGGVITSAAALTMTSTPLRTNPIARGAWVAAVIFNKPPPPPPDVVPEIEADDKVIEASGITLRQRLKMHQEQESCASCHSKIDPLGFALENYDAVGRWRDVYGSGLEIDASGKLFGIDAFTDVVGLKDAILQRPELFMRGFSEHMLSYALGRKLAISDQPAVDLILKELQTERGRFSTLVSAIVRSYPFRSKTNQEDTGK